MQMQQARPLCAVTVLETGQQCCKSHRTAQTDAPVTRTGEGDDSHLHRKLARHSQKVGDGTAQLVLEANANVIGCQADNNDTPGHTHQARGLVPRFHLRGCEYIVQMLQQVHEPVVLQLGAAAQLCVCGRTRAQCDRYMRRVYVNATQGSGF